MGGAGAGAKFDAEFLIDFFKAKLRVRVKAQLFLGLGFEGAIGVKIDGLEIFQLARLVYGALRQTNYDLSAVLEFTDRPAYEALYKLLAWSLSSPLHPLFKSLQFLDDVLEWWRNPHPWLSAPGQAQAMARRISSDPPELCYALPEAKGLLLGLLCHSEATHRTAEGPKAIGQILRWIQSRDEYDDVLANLSPVTRPQAKERGYRLLIDGLGPHAVELDAWAAGLPAWPLFSPDGSPIPQPSAPGLASPIGGRPPAPSPPGLP
jgi:hypothetical protein